MFSLLTTALFTADGIMFILLKLQSQNEEGIDCLIKYEDAMSHFFYLKHHAKNFENNDDGTSTTLSRESSASSFERKQSLRRQRSEMSIENSTTRTNQQKANDNITIEMTALRPTA